MQNAMGESSYCGIIIIFGYWHMGLTSENLVIVGMQWDHDHHVFEGRDVMGQTI